MTARYKPAFNRAIEPLAAAIARSGMSPSAITLACPLLTALVCAWFARSRAVIPFCLLMGFIGGLDAVDGAVARVSGRATRFGAYLDAVCDRYVDALVAITAAYVTGYWLLSMAVLVGALLISYAKARAAMEVPVSNQEWPDLMERTERGALFLVGLLAGALIPWRPLGRDLFWWTLLLLTLLVHLTVLQRVVRARGFIRARVG